MKHLGKQHGRKTVNDVLFHTSMSTVLCTERAHSFRNTHSVIIAVHKHFIHSLQGMNNCKTLTDYCGITTLSKGYYDTTKRNI